MTTVLPAASAGANFQAAINSGADIVVICSSDEEYADIAPEINKKLKDAAIVTLAGYPKEIIEELKSAGLKHFIHMRSNVLESLQEIQKELGI